MELELEVLAGQEYNWHNGGGMKEVVQRNMDLLPGAAVIIGSNSYWPGDALPVPGVRRVWASATEGVRDGLDAGLPLGRGRRRLQRPYVRPGAVFSKLKDYLESEAEEQQKALCFVFVCVGILFNSQVPCSFDLIHDPMSVRLIMLSILPLHEW